MVKYGKEFRKEQKPEWKTKYINYKMLKQQIKQYNSPNTQDQQLIINNEQPQKPKHKSKSETIKNFISLLNDEIKRMYIFFNKEEKSLHRDINTRLYSKDEYNALEKDEFINEFNTLNEISLKTVDLAKYAFFNFKALIKIVKKFDKKCLPPNSRHYIKVKYIQHKLEEQNSDLLDMYKFKIIDEASAIIEDLVKALQIAYKDKKYLFDQNKESLLSQNPLEKKDNEIDNESIQKQSSSTTTTFSSSTMVKQILKNVKTVDQYNMKIKMLFKPWDDFLKISSSLSMKLYNITKELGGIVKEDQTHDTNEMENLDVNVDGFNQLDTSSISNNLPFIFKKEHSIMSNMLISQENKINVKMIFCQTFIYFFSYSIQIPLNINYLTSTLDTQYKEYYTGVFNIMAPLGALCSFLISTKWSFHSTKKPLLFAMSCLLIGNTLCCLYNKYTNIYLILIGRFCVGLGCNRVGNKIYLSNFVPKQYLNKYVVRFHIYTLIGLSLGFLINVPIINAFQSTNLTDDTRDVFLNENNTGTLICSIICFFIFIMSCLFTSDAFDKNFYTTTSSLDGEKIKINRNDQQQINDDETGKQHNTHNDMTLDESIRRDTIMIEDINEQLYQVNEVNKFTETNLVTQSVNTLTINEKKHLKFLKGNFIVFVLIIFTSKVINEFMLINSPLYINIHQDESYKFLSLILGISYIVVLLLEFVNYLTKKCISDRTSLLIILALLTALNGLFIVIYIRNNNSENDLKWKYLAGMTGMILLSNLLEKTASSFFGKIIPNDYMVCCIQGNALVNVIIHVARILGACIIIWFKHDNFNKMITGTLIGFVSLGFISFALSVVFYSDLRVKAISRILLSKEKVQKLQIPNEI